MKELFKDPTLFNDASPKLTPGEKYSYDHPVHGEQIYRYAKMTGAAAVQWSLYKKADGIVSTTFTVDSVGSNPTWDLRDSSDPLTADAWVGCLAYIYTDGANAAPEGEMRRIKTNTTSSIILEKDTPHKPLSAAVAVGDVVHIVNNYAIAVAGTGALDRDEYVGWAAAAITQNYWGCFLCKGQQDEIVSAATMTIGGACKGNALALADATGADKSEESLGLVLISPSGASSCCADVDLISWPGLMTVDT
ncbi:MAG: hypothetical protein GY700_06350 [Propionibacteriaceae bacterium]|nr:hypothetical protein [Propionibacteriaceae bacterium]